MERMAAVDHYISAFPLAVQKRLKTLRQIIFKLAPEAIEGMSYQMPAYRHNGILVYFAAYKNHIGFYALPTTHASFKEELSQYKTGKGSVQFPHSQELPIALIKEMVKYRLIENEANTREC